MAKQSFFIVYILKIFSANSDAPSRGVCECDRALVKTLYNEVPAFIHYEGDDADALCGQGKLYISITTVLASSNGAKTHFHNYTVNKVL